LYRCVTAAFALIDASRANSYVAACHTTYVFVTDGVAADPRTTVLSRRATATGADEHHFVISLGSGTDQADLRGTSCAIGAVFTAVPDNDEAALQRAMVGYYKYYALQKTLSKVEGYSWTEPYTSIPDIWGPLTSVSAPVYDKSRGDTWHMIGVASADTTVCDLVAKTPDTAAPAVPVTTRNCACSDKWSYKGVAYEGCSDVDWPVPWCATAPGCGVCGVDSVSTGCWDDCKPTGKAAALEAELVKRATSWCETSSVPPCAVEALRSLMDKGNTCSSVGAKCDAAAMETYRWAIDGPAAATMTPAVGYTVDSTAGALAGTMYDGDSGACGCSAMMLPVCACASIRSPPPPPPPSMDDDGDIMDLFGGAGGIGGLIGGAAALLFAGVFGCYRCCRPKAPPPPQQQQLQQYPTGAYPAGAVQMQQMQNMQPPPYGAPPPQYGAPPGYYPAQPQPSAPMQQQQPSYYPST
jgi:hypothetical protein